MDEPLVFRLSRQRHCRVATFGRDNRLKHLSGKPTSRFALPEGPSKTTRLIGWVYKRSNALS